MLAAVKSYLHRVYERYKSQREGRTSTVYTITHDADAMTLSWLTVENQTGQTILRWRDVIRLEAFKRDCWAVDSIRLAFIESDDRAVETHEDMKGWDSLVEKLPEYLPGCQKFEEWFTTVAYSTFELNLTQIYQRAST